MTQSTPPPATDRPRAAYLVVLALAFGLAAVWAAYFDWIHWVEEQGSSLIVGLAAGVVLIVAGLIATVARRRLRQVALVPIVLSLGIFAGLLLGPSRAPLLDPRHGTITLHLTSPIVATATGPAVCRNVSDGNEFQVGNDENTTRLDTADPAFVSIAIDKGSRWEALSPDHRTNGVFLAIRITPTAVAGDGKPGTSGRRTSSTSSVSSTFTNAGGSLMFANLEEMTGPDLGGPAMDLTGTIDWSCGAPGT